MTGGGGGAAALRSVADVNVYCDGGSVFCDPEFQNRAEFWGEALLSFTCVMFHSIKRLERASVKPTAPSFSTVPEGAATFHPQRRARTRLSGSGLV